MARPISDGLTYFSLDTDMDQDDKIAFIESKHGLVGFAVVIRLMMRIYRNGYTTMWTEREQYLFAKNINVDIMSTLTIVNDCINEGLFNKDLYDKYGLLTSHGIQKRYIKSCERRKKIFMAREYLLVDPVKDDLKFDNVTLTSINVDINLVNSNIMSTSCEQEPPLNVASGTQSKVKEIESKVKEIEKETRARDDNPVVDNVDILPPDNKDLPVDDNPDFMAFWRTYPKPTGMANALIEWNKLADQGIKEQHVILAARRYALHVKKQNIVDQYVKLPQNFLSNGAFFDYMPMQLPDCPTCKGNGNYLTDDYPSVSEQCRCRDKLYGKREKVS